MKNKTSLKHEAENDAITWLAKLNSPQLTPAQEQEFMQWLESSPLHQAAYIKAEQLWERGAVLSRLPTTSKTNFWQFDHWGFSTKGFAVACSFLLIAMVGFFSFLTKTSHFTYQTAMGEVRDVQLEDGSHITLNTNTQLKVELSRKKRIVYLTQGEVFFDVKKDGRPFEVVTQFGVARVVGTRLKMSL
jgi:transmembrane sensor